MNLYSMVKSMKMTSSQGGYKVQLCFSLICGGGHKTKCRNREDGLSQIKVSRENIGTYFLLIGAGLAQAV
jgi:hypothetical protein